MVLFRENQALFWLTVWLNIGMSFLESLQVFQIGEYLHYYWHFLHVDFEPLGVVDLWHQERVGCRHLVPHAILSAPAAQKDLLDRQKSSPDPVVCPLGPIRTWFRTVILEHSQILQWLGTRIDHLANFSNLNKIRSHDRKVEQK